MMTADLALTCRMIANHLWQSTLAACVAAALVWLLRKSEARLRHGLWMAASLKFLVPFAVLVELGRRLATQQSFTASDGPILTTVLQIGQPFVSNGAPNLELQIHPHHAFPWLLVLLMLWAAGSAAVVIAWITRWLRVRSFALSAVPQLAGREVERLRAAQIAAAIHRPIPLLVSKGCMEPGIFGIFHPVLLWPEGISPHLDDEQLGAIVAHEVCHVRRRDNLFALLHMCVEAAFWFHPLVWWMGARLVEERERACDEAVLRLGNEPGSYADAILKACRYSIESPLACVSGVSGSNLKQRMVRIMNAATIPLSRSRKMLLATVALAAIAGPIGMGILHPRVVRAGEAQDLALRSDEAQSFANLRFDSASLTPAAQGDGNRLFLMQHEGQFALMNVTLKALIATAYGVPADRIVSGPDWIDTQHYNFEAHWTPPAGAHAKMPAPDKLKAEFQIATAGNGAPGHNAMVAVLPTPAPVQAMLRNFLAEHVNLKIRNDSAVMPVYELVIANGGSKLTPNPASQPAPGETPMEMKTRVEASIHNGQQSIAMIHAEPRMLCENLSRELGQEVVDKTGLTGHYDFQVSFPAGADADQVASILRDQYGLDLQSTQQPVKVFAVDNVDMPQAN
jgi:bla regulator protein blaR1